MRAVIDSNVWISGLISPLGSPAAIIRELMRGGFDPASIPRLLEELERAARKPRITRRHPALAQRSGELVEFLRQRAILVTPESTRPVSRDPDDDEVLAVAFAAQATHVVSGDRDLLDDEAVATALADADIALMTPAEFVVELQRSSANYPGD